MSDSSGGRHKQVTVAAHNGDMARPTSSDALSWRHVPRPVLVVALVTAVCLLGDSALYVLLPSHLDAFAVSPTGAGLILGINRYIRIASNSGAGWLFERVGIRVPLLFAVLLAAATTAAGSNAPVIRTPASTEERRRRRIIREEKTHNILSISKKQDKPTVQVAKELVETKLKGL